MTSDTPGDPSPWAMSRRLEHVARSWRVWKRGLLEDDGWDDDPFALERCVTTRRAFQDASALGEHDPLREPLRRWVYRLLEQRINRACLVELRRLGSAERCRVEEPVRGEWSLAEMLRRAVALPEQRGAWLQSWSRLSHPLSLGVRQLWKRRRLVASGLGLEHPDEIELPSAEIDRVAHEWLLGSADLWATVGPRGLTDWLHAASGWEAREGWPARMTPQSVQALMGEPEWLRGVTLDPGRLPRALVPASFLRALARMGAAWVDGVAPTDQPFVVAHDPYGLRRRLIGALFATLPLNPEFVRRRLSVPAHARSRYLRVLSRVVLAEARKAALSVLLRAALLRGGSAAEELPSLSQKALGVVLRPEWCGALVRLHVDTPQRFAGLLLAATQVAELIQQHDADWFRNPRAVEQVRAEANLPPPARASQEALTRGGQALSAWLSELLA
jgi:hypothetical protein